MARSEKHSPYFTGYQRKIYYACTYLPKKPCDSKHGGSQRPSHGGFFKIHGRPHFSVPGGHHMSHYGHSDVNHKVASHILHEDGKHIGTCGLSNGSKDLQKDVKIQTYERDIYNHGLSDNKTNDFFFKEKETMQILNERLVFYLEKIQSLEQRNAHLEKMINEWHIKNSPTMPTDQSQYSKDIHELQSQISSVISKNTSIILKIDNDSLALDDLNNKYEMEHMLRSNIEADVKDLHHIWEGCKEETGILESEIEILELELLRMRRDSEQEINHLTTQLGTRVSVEVEVAKSKDLATTLSDIQEHYENIMESNQRETERLFTQMAKKLHYVENSSYAQLNSDQSKIITLKSSIQILEIELQSEQTMISVLEDILEEKKAFYSSDIIEMQMAINIVQVQLQQIRLHVQSLHEANNLLSKDSMHHEITTYQKILDEQLIQRNEDPPPSNDTGQINEGDEEVPDKPIPINP